MRSQQETVALLDVFENLVQHCCTPDSIVEAERPRPSSIVKLMTPFLVTFQKLIDSGCVSLRAVQLKIQLGWTAQVQTLSHFTANEADRRSQSLQRAFRFLVVALDDHENPRRAGIASQHHTAHAGQPDAGIAEFAFDDGFN